MPDRWTLAALNSATADEQAQLSAALHACCAADSWAADLLAHRTYADAEALGSASDAATAALDEVGFEQALAGHPRIGARLPTAGSGASDASAGGHAAWSSQEQAGMNSADEELRSRLAAANVEYEARFGQVYLVCATGLSASELLARCEDRLANDPATERSVVLGELAKINRIRLGKLVDS
jgi:2-oxo-4-hydroxy-4-carboxy-5-ureidoimidazoline decarboxylase